NGLATGVKGLFDRAQPAGLDETMVLQERDDLASRMLNSHGPEGGDGGPPLHCNHTDLWELTTEIGPRRLAAAVHYQNFCRGRPFLTDQALQALGDDRQPSHRRHHHGNARMIGEVSRRLRVAGRCLAYLRSTTSHC